MRASRIVMPALLFLALVPALARAQCCYGCILHPVAPDACGPGFYVYRPYEACGCLYGPYYCLRPQTPCFNGLQTCRQLEAQQQQQLQQQQQAIMSPQAWAYPQAFGLPPGAFTPCPQQQGGILAFPTHPFARSPRDFFMAEIK